MELDLTQEDQTDTSVIGFGSILNELESDNGHIEERIRCLEAVTSRARQHQRWPPVHSPIQITNFTAELSTDNFQDEDVGHQEEEGGVSVEESNAKSGKWSKGRSTDLVAKALEMETFGGKARGSTGNFYDCNICLDMARDPVLTCCGHLFCWPCFYQVSYAYSNAKECPVCKGEVTETGIVPIYGNASVGSSCHLELEETGLRVPPRPDAPRIESIRQKLITQGASSSTIQNIRRLNNLIGGLEERIQFGSTNIATDGTNALATRSRLETENNLHSHSHQFLRLLVQGAGSFSSLSSPVSSEMGSADRLPEDLESYIHSHHIGRSRQLNRQAVYRDSPFSFAAPNQSESLALDVAAVNSAAAAAVSPLIRNDDATAVIDSEIQTTGSSVRLSSFDPSSSSSRRRNGVSRRASNQTRRRRLR